MLLRKYSKSYQDLYKIKKQFLTRNQHFLDKTLAINRKFAVMAAIDKCRICATPFAGVDFTSFEVDYSICRKCGHVNGMFDDGETFNSWLYQDDDDEGYAEFYLHDYEARIEHIYTPKVEFLAKVLDLDGCRDFTVRDMGAGSGSFVKALELMQYKAEGFEPNKPMFDFGKSKLKKNALHHCDISDVYRLIEESTADVVSMIGVLEHIAHPLRAVENFCKSETRYLYLSLPTMSLSVFIEHAHPGIFPRHLGGAHTHLFSRESLDYLVQKFNLKMLGTWWFGLDIPSLLRSLMLANENNHSAYFTQCLEDNMLGMVDALQAVVDEAEFCSEVHVVLAK